YIITGFISGDTDASLNNTNSSYDSIHAGSRTLTVNGITISSITGSNGSEMTDYSVNSSANKAATITAKALTANITNSNVSKVYDGTTNAPAGFTPTYNFSGLVSADTAATLNHTGMAYNDTHVSTADTLTVSGLSLASVTGSNGSLITDYNFTPSSLDVTASISPKALTASLTNNGITKVYDGTNSAPAGFAPTYSITGFISGDTDASLTNSGSTYNTAHVATANLLTVNGMAISGITGSNGSLVSDYSVNSSANKAATITAKALTANITNSNVTKVYDGMTNAPAGFTPTYNFTGLVSGDTDATLNHTGMAYNDTHVSTADTLTVSGLSLASVIGSNGSLITDYNFTPSSLDITASISPKALTASLTNNGITKVYDGTNSAPAGFAPTYSITGFISGDTDASLTNSGSTYN